MLNFLISDIWFGDGSDLEWFVALTFVKILVVEKWHCFEFK